MRNLIYKRTVLLLVLVAGCFVMYAQPPGSGWGNPIFADEFNTVHNTATGLNANIWRWKANGGDGTGEGQFKQNMVTVSGGVLTIKNDMVGSEGQAGRRGGWVDSKQFFGNGAAFPKYGYFEAEVKIDLSGINFPWQGGKIWPTWWVASPGVVMCQQNLT